MFLYLTIVGQHLQGGMTDVVVIEHKMSTYIAFSFFNYSVLFEFCVVFISLDFIVHVILISILMQIIC